MFRRATSPRRRRAAKLAVVSALAVVPATLPALTAHAEVAQSYPGGCIVAYATTAPASCTYVSIGGEPVRVVFEGTGTVSLSGCSSGGLAASPPGTYATAPQSAGCTYTLAISGTGIATAVNGAAGALGECSDESDGLVFGDFSECIYDGVTTSGKAIGVAISPLPAAIDISVQDVSAGGGTLATCTVSGTGVIDLTCPYAETLGHEYDVTATDPTFNDVLLALVAAG